MIVLAKNDPDNDNKILFDSHYLVADDGIVDVVKNLIEEIEEETTT